MNSEMILKQLYEIRNNFENGDVSNTKEAINILIENMKEEIRNKCAKTSGKTSQRNALKRILKEAKEGLYGKDYMQFPWVQNGKQWFCSGFSLVGLNNPMEWDETSDKSATNPDAQRLLDSQKSHEAVKLPNLEKLKAYIKIQKAEGNKKPLFSFGDKTFDAQSLVNIMEALPNAAAFDDGGKYKAMMLETNEGIGLIMPTRPPKDFDKKPTNLD